MREDLVQAGGGNSSYKMDGHKMAVKASGFLLADVNDKTGYAVVDAGKIREAFLDGEKLDRMTECESKKILEDAVISGGRPSIETFLHAISEKYTLHTHPVVVNALTCREDWREELEPLFPDALYVPYATPGMPLAKAFFKAYEEYGRKAPGVVFLQNHGLVVSAESADEVIEKTEQVVMAIEKFLGCDYEGYHKLTELWGKFPEKIIWKVTDKNILDMAEKGGGIWQHAFCPDCVVFLGKKALVIAGDFTEKQKNDFERDYGEPVMVWYAGHLYIISDSLNKAMETQSVMSFSAQVMGLNQGIRCSLLPDREQDFLLGWDAEKYRKSRK